MTIYIVLHTLDVIKTMNTISNFQSINWVVFGINETLISTVVERRITGQWRPAVHHGTFPTTITSYIVEKAYSLSTPNRRTVSDHQIRKL